MDTLDEVRLQFVGGYQIVRRLASGSQGDVFVAKKPGIDREIALKLFRDNWPDRQKELFLQEVTALAKLCHPNIVTMYDAGIANGQPWIAMQLVCGQPLGEWLADQMPIDDSGLYNHRLLIEPAIQICKAMDYAHRNGVIHRDLKPGNIIVDSNSRPYIADFGLSQIGSDFSEVCGEFVGTLQYASTEQLSGEAPTERDDIYSLGLIIAEMCCGICPRSFSDSDFREISPTELFPAIDKDLLAILQKCLRQDPTGEYVTAQELKADLQNYANGNEIAARKRSMAERCTFAVRARWQIAAIVLLVSAAAGFYAAGLRAELSARTVQASAYAAAFESSITAERSTELVAADDLKAIVIRAEESVEKVRHYAELGEWVGFVEHAAVISEAVALLEKSDFFASYDSALAFRRTLYESLPYFENTVDVREWLAADSEPGDLSGCIRTERGYAEFIVSSNDPDSQAIIGQVFDDLDSWCAFLDGHDLSNQEAFERVRPFISDLCPTLKERTEFLELRAALLDKLRD